MASQKKFKLSKNLLEMKFMKRSKEKVETEINEIEAKLLFENDIPESLKKNGSRYIIEPSFVPCEDLIFGRMSFRGQNPEIEKIMKDLELERQEKITKMTEEAGTVSAEEMADRYSNLIGTVGKKFMNKRERATGDSPSTPNTSRKRMKFLKPEN